MPNSDFEIDAKLEIRFKQHVELSAMPNSDFEIERLLQQTLDLPEVRNMFSCEKDTRKQDFIRKVVHVLPGCEDACMFSDIGYMGAARADCVTHGRRCPIRKSHMASCGFSCKDFSKANTSFRQCDNVLESGHGTSGETFSGMRAFLKTHCPAVMQLENVEKVALNETELKYLADALHEAGYVLIYDIIIASEYGFPTTRSRFFGLALRLAAWPDKTETELEMAGKAVFELQRKMRLDPLPMNSFLRSHQDQYVAGEMRRRMKSPDQVQGLTWVKQHQRFCTQMSIPLEQLIPPLDQTSSEFYALLTKREREVLGFNINDWRSRDPPKELGFIDVSQSLNRAPASEPDLLPTILPGIAHK